MDTLIKSSKFTKSLFLIALLSLVLVLSPSTFGASANYTTVNLEVSKNSFVVGEHWALSIASNQYNKPVTLCTRVPSYSCTPASMLGLTPNTNSIGEWSASGTFTSNDIGPWTEYAIVNSNTSNDISFTVSPAPVADIHLSINKNIYNVGETWALTLTSNQYNKPVTLCTRVPSYSCTPASMLGLTPNTDSFGSWSATGNFTNSEIGPWTEYAIINSNNSNDISFTVTPAATPIPGYVHLSINGSNFVVGDHWALSLTSNIKNKNVLICSKTPSPSGNSCTPAGNLGYPSTTDFLGSWSASGTFSSNDIGTWTEYAIVDTNNLSNDISFIVSPAGTPVPTPTPTSTCSWWQFCGTPTPTPVPTYTPTPSPVCNNIWGNCGPTPTPIPRACNPWEPCWIWPTPIYTPAPTPNYTPVPTPGCNPIWGDCNPAPTPIRTCNPWEPCWIWPTPTYTPGPTPSPSPTCSWWNPWCNSGSNGSLAIAETITNTTKGYAETSSTTAWVDDNLEFTLRVTANGSSTIDNVKVLDTLPLGLRYLNGSTTVNGTGTSNDVIANNLILGNLTPGQTVTVKFQALVDSNYVNGQQQLVSRATATADNASEADDNASVVVYGNVQDNQYNYYQTSGYQYQTFQPTSFLFGSLFSNETTQTNNYQLSIQNFGEDITKGVISEQTSVTASPNDTVAIFVHVKSLSSATLYNIIVNDTLPAGLSYIPGTATLNGAAALNGITESGGLSINSLSPGQEVIIKFSALVAPATNFAAGTTSTLNTVRASANNGTGANAQLPISIINGQVLGASITKIAGVATGTTDSLIFSLLFSTLVTLIYMGYTKTGIFKKRDAQSVVKKHLSDINRFNFAR